MSALREALSHLPDAVFADLLESDDAFLLVLDLPGATRDTVDVTAESGQLRIEARREKDVPDGFRYRTEERSLFLDVDIPLPPVVATDGASASMDRGVLEIHLPKTRAAEAQEIPIDG